MIRIPLISAFIAAAAAADAQTETETSCAYQAEVVAAVQTARLNDVDQSSSRSAVLEAASWPEKFNAIIPIVTPWIYGLSEEDLAGNDLAQIWNAGCLEQG